AKLIEEAGWAGRGRGMPFYLVGGSWRSLARLDIHLSGYPLPVAHQYAIPVERVAILERTLAELSRAELKAIPDLSSARLPTLGHAAALLVTVLDALGSAGTIVSAYGLREGLSFARLAPEQRRRDPLIEAAREEGDRLGRFAEHGDLLDAWIAPLFTDEPPETARLRHAACLLADVGWNANPEFRAERGLEIALHGHWVGIDAAGRAVVAQTLYTALGGAMATPDPLGLLATPEALQRARLWGLAIRLGQRMSGGVAGPIKRSRLEGKHGALVLSLKGADVALYSEAVEKRHKALANAMGLDMAFEG
ncbi:MAG: Ppx/GppA family phosphatase, partial [Sphingomonadales bacterium]